MESQDRPPLPAPLERLPLHVFELICEYVPRRGLFSLSLASRLCCLASTPQRFSRLKLRILREKKLRDDLQRWIAILGRDNRFRHVRKVVVAGSMTNMPTCDYSDSDSDSENTPESGQYSPSWPHVELGHKVAQHDAWLPFAHFLAQLPGLTDLVHACTDQIPACVLEALHQHHPRSRLHMRIFSLRSLYQHGNQPHDIDPDEYLLVTSPCLYSIHIKYEYHDKPGRFSFNKEAVEHMVASGCAPRLRRVRIDDCTSWDAVDASENGQGLGGPWRGFFGRAATMSPQQSLTRPGRTSVEELVISSDCAWVGPDTFDFWNRRTDLSALQQLGLYFHVSVQLLETLALMAASNKLHPLRELGLSLFSLETHENTIACLDQPTSLLLRAVPRLEAITLKGRVGKRSFEAALRCHGKTIRKLHLEPHDDGHVEFVLGHERVREIQKQCPRLEDICLRVRRHQGRPEEVAVYRALGRMSRLRRATLLLDCRPGLSVPGDVAANEAEIIRSTLINIAIDRALAYAIFKEVFPSTDSADSPLKQRLRVQPDLAFSMVEGVYDSDYDDVVSWVAQSWECVRDRRRDDEVRVRRIGELGRNRWYTDEVWFRLQRISQECRDVWRELWPPRNADVEELGPPRNDDVKALDWIQDWTSTPLSSEGIELDTSDER